MPIQLSLALLPTPDLQIVDALRAVTQSFPRMGNPVFQWRLFQNESYNSTAFQETASNVDIQSILAQNGEVFSSCGITFHTTSSANQGSNGAINIERQSDGTLTLQANCPEGLNNDSAAKTEFVIAVRNSFTRFSRSKILQAFGPEISDFYSRRESTLIQLESLNTKIVSENDQHRRDLETALEETRLRLEKTFQDKQHNLETEYQSKAAILAAKGDELDQRKKLLDDRDNTHARREIQQDLKQVLRERNTDFSLTVKTIRKRLPSAVAMVTIMTALAGTSAWALWTTTHAVAKDVPFWYPLVRFALSLSAFVSSAVFFIRWQDRWSEAHAAEEFRLKRFDLDIARASWLVEVMLEWNSTKSEFPKELIQNLASGLFQQVPSGPMIKHPAEEILGALLSSSSVNLKLPGGDVNLDRKGIRDMSKKTE